MDPAGECIIDTPPYPRTSDPRDGALRALKIVQVVKEFSQAGGVESVAYELHHAFRAKGVAASVLAGEAPGASGPEVTLVVPALQRIATRGRGRYAGRLLAVPLFTLAVTRAIRRVPAGSVVLSHGDSLAGDYCVIHAVNKASLRQKRKAGQWSWRLNPMHLWVGLRDRWMIGGLRFKAYVALSNQVVEDLVRLYAVPRERIVVIPNGVNLARFDAGLADRAVTRAALGVPPLARLLLFVGHEFGRKGLAHAIDALALLPPDCWLLVAGSDNPAPYRRQAEAAGVGGRVMFAGPRRDLPALYRAADLFVLPTAYETFSLVCMEAMACGLPVLGTRAGGMEEYIEDDVNGCFIERDARDIAAKAMAVLGDETLHARMRLGARATAERYRWEAIAERYIDLLTPAGR